MTAAAPTLPPPVLEPHRAARVHATARFLGWQEDGKGGHLALWNLLRDIPGHPVGSTVLQSTIEAALFGKTPRA